MLGLYLLRESWDVGALDRVGKVFATVCQPCPIPRGAMLALIGYCGSERMSRLVRGGGGVVVWVTFGLTIMLYVRML